MCVKVQLLLSQCSLCTSPLHKKDHTPRVWSFLCNGDVHREHCCLLIYTIRHVHKQKAALYDQSTAIYTVEGELCTGTHLTPKR